MSGISSTWKTNREIQPQVVAVRGFRDNDGTITGLPGTFVGDANPALNTSQLQGPGTFQPGWDLSAGWKFQGGVVVELNWKHLIEASYNASASILPPNTAQVGNLLQNTFLYSGVSNFPEQIAGVAQKVALGQPGSVYGIWNGASVMQEQLVQCFDIYQVNVRVPMYQGENYRSYGILGRASPGSGKTTAGRPSTTTFWATPECYSRHRRVGTSGRSASPQAGRYRPLGALAASAAH